MWRCRDVESIIRSTKNREKRATSRNEGKETRQGTKKETEINHIQTFQHETKKKTKPNQTKPWYISISQPYINLIYAFKIQIITSNHFERYE